MLLAACAGGMAWGIRGQYGHETGAMLAGVLVGFVLILLHGRHLTGLQNARAVALFALGISIGGSMTYGQTVGLTHDGPLVGNVDAYRWGMIGLAIKGGIWISFGAMMFGMGLGGRRYGWLELTLLVAAMVGGLILGVYLLNQPFAPEQKLLPNVYFSDHWYWEPDVNRPRRERWGGLLVALVVLFGYLAMVKRDRLACYLGIWGLLAGALGFPAGQAVQSYHAWHRDWLHSLPTHGVTDHFNWWNMMETTFGFVFGGILGLAVWCHRRRIERQVANTTNRNMPLLLELLLLSIHVRLLIAWNFQSIDWLDAVADLAIPMIALPLLVVFCGRYGAFLVALPITLLPIAGKTFQQLSLHTTATPVELGLELYLAGPLLIATSVAVLLALNTAGRRHAGWFAPIGLVTATWLYFLLNDAVFLSPWIWVKPWTNRTVNGFLFFVFSICLTIAAAWYAPDLSEPKAGDERRGSGA